METFKEYLNEDSVPYVKNVVVPPPAVTNGSSGGMSLDGRAPTGVGQVTHAYRNISVEELNHARDTGYFQVNPNPKLAKTWDSEQKFWSSGDEQGIFGRPWKGAGRFTVRVPIDKVPADTAVDVRHVQIKNGGGWVKL
ncbi:MAG: hypothetical protein WCO72_15905 [Betaproteobacteria bacterium]